MLQSAADDSPVVIEHINKFNLKGSIFAHTIVPSLGGFLLLRKENLAFVIDELGIIPMDKCKLVIWLPGT